MVVNDESDPATVIFFLKLEFVECFLGEKILIDIIMKKFWYA